MGRVKELGRFFPEWYKKWLFESLGIEDGSEISDKYLEPLFKLNKNWLKENYDKGETDWNRRDTATAYALYYMTVNIPKLWMTLENSETLNLQKIDSVAEYGCGPGTFLWAFLFYLKEINPQALAQIKSVKGVDSSSENLRIAEKLFKSLKQFPEFSHISGEFSQADWQDEFPGDSHSLKIFGNALVESEYDPEILLKSNCEDLLIIEPGTVKHFQRLRKIRDLMVKSDWQIKFPCTGGDTCPLAEDNWCHFHVNRFILPFVQRMSNAAGRKNHRHNFSAFLFSKSLKDNSKERWRMLSEVRKVKRTAIRYICNGDKVVEAVLSRKEKSENNRDFIDSPPGSCCQCSDDIPNGRIKEKHIFRRI